MQPVEEFRFFLTAHGLCLQCHSEGQKKALLTDLKSHGIEKLLADTPGADVYFNVYTNDSTTGWFLSEHQRLGLLFPSESAKFYFKERVGLHNEHFMNMGRGYENQLHFNEKFLAAVPGRSLVTTTYAGRAQDGQ